MKKHTKEIFTKHILKIALSPLFLIGFIIYAVKDMNNGRMGKM